MDIWLRRTGGILELRGVVGAGRCNEHVSEAGSKQTGGLE